MYRRNKSTSQPDKIFKYFQLWEVCGRWISKGGMPDVCIYNTGKHHYRIKFSYPDVAYNCQLRQYWGATSFYLYGHEGVTYDAERDMLSLSSYGDYFRAED